MSADLPLVSEQFSEVTLERVREAHARIEGQIHRTPVHTSRQLNERVGAEVFLKLESFQRTGSFKFRGATNAIALLKPEERERGVLTFSSGNHGAALALAGREAGVPVTVVMPEDAPPTKRAATESYGAEIIPFDRSELKREQLGLRLAEERGLKIVPPYDHAHIIAGAGTAALELMEQVSGLDVVIACLGGGGLLAGTSVAVRGLSSEVQVWGAEPAQADDGYRSLHSGSIQTVDDPVTIADGARTPYVGQRNFAIMRHFVTDIARIEEQEMVESMQFLWERMKLVVEPTGTLAFAAVWYGKVPVSGKRVGVIISGGNTTLPQL